MLTRFAFAFALLVTLSSCSRRGAVAGPAARPTDTEFAAWALEAGRRVLATLPDRAAAARLGTELTGVVVGVTYYTGTDSTSFKIKVLVRPDGAVRLIDFTPGSTYGTARPWTPLVPAGLRSWDAYIRWNIASERCAPWVLVTREEGERVTPGASDIAVLGLPVRRATLLDRCSVAIGALRVGAQPATEVWFVVYTTTGDVSGRAGVGAGSVEYPPGERTTRFNGA